MVKPSFAWLKVSHHSNMKSLWGLWDEGRVANASSSCLQTEPAANQSTNGNKYHAFSKGLKEQNPQRPFITAQHISDSSALPAPCDQTHVISHSRARKSQAPKFYSVSCLSIFRTYFFSNSVSLPLLHRFCMMRLSVHRRQTSLCNPTDFDAKRVSQAASGLTKCRSLDEALRNYWGWEHHGARHVHEGTGRGIP